MHIIKREEKRDYLPINFLQNYVLWLNVSVNYFIFMEILDTRTYICKQKEKTSHMNMHQNVMDMYKLKAEENHYQCH